jgi:Smg protein
LTANTESTEAQVEKFVIALNLVIDYIDTSDKVNEKDLADYLQQTGFEDNEIRQVLAILDMNSFPPFSGYRYFSRKEKNIFTDEAMNYLQKLHITGVMDMLTLETVIESILDSDSYRVGVEQVKNHVLFTLMEKKSLFLEGEGDYEDYNH